MLSCESEVEFHSLFPANLSFGGQCTTAAAATIRNPRPCCAMAPEPIGLDFVGLGLPLKFKVGVVKLCRLLFRRPR